MNYHCCIPPGCAHVAGKQLVLGHPLKGSELTKARLFEEVVIEAVELDDLEALCHRSVCERGADHLRGGLSGSQAYTAG